MKSRYIKLYRAYVISFNSSNLGIFLWIGILKTVSKFRKRKTKLLCYFPNYVKLGIFSRGVTAKKCTKKRDARAKLLFCQSKPFCFFAVLVDAGP